MKLTVKLICILAFATVIAGCTTTKRKVTITSNPTAAEVRATADKNGPKDFVLGMTPLTHEFEFKSSGPQLYNLTFSKPGFESKTLAYQKDDPANSLNANLDKEVVKEVPKLVVKVSEDKGYTVERQVVRAWIEDIEREGMAASSIVRLGANQSIAGITISPDGSTLYFSIAEQIKDEQGQDKVMANIRAVTATGGGITQITSGQWLDSSPSITPDGAYLIFNSNRIQRDKPDLFRISTTKTGGIAVIRQTSEGANYQPSAGSNSLIAFTYKPKYEGRLSGAEQIWTLGGENSYPTQLKAGSMPALSPDGKEIAFIGDDHQLWKMPITGQNPVQLTGDHVNKEGKRNPTWSPDGHYILFSSDVGKDNKDVANYDIWIIPSNGGVPRQLTTNGSEDDFPVVSPNQRFIYFVSNRGFKEGIWRMPFPSMGN